VKWKADKKNFSIMPAGTPHCVLGTSDAICMGRFFYTSLGIRSSVLAMVHTFLFGYTVTNDHHHETRTLLYQLMAFWSMRMDRSDVDGVFD
jgi:hypothetical protein